MQNKTDRPINRIPEKSTKTVGTLFSEQKSPKPKSSIIDSSRFILTFFFLGAARQEPSAWKLRNKSPRLQIFSILLTVLLFSSMPLIATAATVTTDLQAYGVGETVRISLTGLSIDNYLSITTPNEVLQFSGELKDVIEYYPQSLGKYALTLSDSQKNIISEANFSVSKTPQRQDTTLISTDKKEYSLGEQVTITTSNIPGENDEIIITTDTETYKYLGETGKDLAFIPKTPGAYTAQLRQDFITLASAPFTVSNSSETSTPIKNTSSSDSGNLGWNGTIDMASDTGIPTAETSNNMPSDQTTAEAQTETTEIVPRPPFQVRTIGERGKSDVETTLLGQKNGEYDIEITPKKAGVKKITIQNLKPSEQNASAPLEFKFDEVNLKKEEFGKELRDKRSLKSFYIDPTGMNFTNGSITLTAVGRELWKCKDWNSTTLRCTGTWNKIMNLVPGQEYTIEISPADPGYTETGVASINTLKPVYHPNETAGIIIAVLDTQGRLVSHANIQMTITKPDNTTQTLTTGSGQIIENTKGIYTTNTNQTGLEGTYNIFLTATGLYTNTTMQTTFDVKSFYEFDIIRTTAVTTDPWQGPFSSKVALIPLINVSSFDYTEVVPINLQVSGAIGAEQRTVGNFTLLTWKGLTAATAISYLLQPPLITPNYFELGPSFMTYTDPTDSIIKTYFEARLWQIVIDPLYSILFDDFQSGWGCVRGIASPTAANNCSITPWGSFNQCNDNNGDYLFCTTQYGQEGTRTTQALHMIDWDAWNASKGVCYNFDPMPYDDLIISGYLTASGLDAGEFCRAWARDSDNASTIYNCPNTNLSCNDGDTTPEGIDYDFWTLNVSTLTQINLTENISICLGAQMSATNENCFWDRINITALANYPNITNLTYPANGSTITTNSTIQLNFTVNHSKNIPLANCTLWADFNSTWAENVTIYNVTRNNVTNITQTLIDGVYQWNIVCYTLAGLSDFYDFNYTLTMNVNPPIKTVVNIDLDYAAPYNTTNRNPYINISLNENASCRISQTNESYANMINDYNCTGQSTKNANCTYTGTQLPIGSNTIYVACNDTTGQADDASSNLAVTFTVLCDSHADCNSNQYCDTTQQCASDILPGYNCIGVAYTGLGRDEVCGDGTSQYCVNDSSYSFTGWYCTDSTSDCVYNDNGMSYDLGYELCELSTNDFRTCSLSNLWGSLVDCAEANDPYNQSATTHTGEYCEYYAVAQSCVNSTNGGCSGSATTCSQHIFNLTTLTCGNTLSQCDIGCGAACDYTNSTTAENITGICYYDKTCSNACAWSQSSETAPNFCINDNDGGTCIYTSRTDPTTAETCYWTPTCADTVGAGLSSGTANNLRADYCDYCNATGNQSGSYSPTPNASCASNCANSDIIYYDSGLTPANRADDCSNGATTILSDTLSIGDIWNASAPAYCDNTECDLDCGTLVGTCNLGLCVCVDNDNPSLDPVSPAAGTWTNNPEVTFTFTISDLSSGIQNCSLITNGTTLQTNTSNTESPPDRTITQNFINGTYNWSILCFDNSSTHNSNQTDGRFLGIDTTNPSASAPTISGTSFNISQSICLNLTVSDTYSGINIVKAQIEVPGQPTENITLSDSSTTPCDTTNGNGVYSVQYELTFSGTFNWSYYFAKDNANNQVSSYAGLTWNVSQGSNVTIFLNAPTANLKINESDFSNTYNQSCTATCNNGSYSCNNIYIIPQIYKSGIWIDMNSTTMLTPSATSLYCGNLSGIGIPNWWNTSWNKRKPIYLSTNSTTNLTNVAVVVNVTGLSGNISNCTKEIRVVDINNTLMTVDILSGDNLNYCEITFTANITNNTNNQNRYYVYYNNSGSTVGTPANLPTPRYPILFENFDGAGWTVIATIQPVAACAGGVGLFNGCVNFATDFDLSATTTGTHISGARTLVFDQVTPFNSTRAVMYNFSALSRCGGDTCDDIIVQGYIAMSSTDAATEYAMIWSRNSSGENYSIIYQCVDATACEFTTGDAAPTNVANYTFFSRLLKQNLSQALTSTMFVHLSGVGSAADDNFFFEDINITGTRKQAVNVTAASAGITQEYFIGLSNISNCTQNFTMTANITAGNTTQSVRCTFNSTNSPTTLTENRNITINDHPTPSISYPANNSWITGTISINASTSTDSDGTITTYTFDYDNTTTFTSPTTICSTSQSNCTWNTLLQDQCVNNSRTCYLRVTARDSDGLNETYIITLGFDTQIPTTTVDRPYHFENITTNTFTVNATVTDSESGVNTVILDYKINSTQPWTNICQDTTQPYECVWNLAALPDGTDYQVRGYANDSVGNLEQTSNKTNITVDREPPIINLESPANNNFSNNTIIAFRYNATDTTGNIKNCSITIDGSITQSDTNPPENTTNTFTETLTEGTHYWNITCIDNLENQNTTQTRNITIDITGPTTTIDEPDNSENIVGVSTFKANATAIDTGVGTISYVQFEYRTNSTENWNLICQDLAGPEFNCTWALAGLPDGNYYEVRAYANDTLGNNGSYDIRTGITIDNNGPNITLIFPPNQTTDFDGDLLFQYSTNDTASTVAGCNLIWNGAINQTQTGPLTEGQTYQFQILNVSNGNYYWRINCTDGFGQETTSETRNITIDIKYVLFVNVTTTQQDYARGNEQSETFNATNNVTGQGGGSILAANTTTDIVRIYNLTEKVPGWWNTSWNKRKPIYLSTNSTTNLTNVAVIINITGLTGNISSCANELRIVDVDNNLISADILSGDNTNHCEVTFTANVTANATNENNYFAYYNNPSSSSSNPANLASPRYTIFFESFEGTGWTQITTGSPATGCVGGSGQFNGCINFATDMDFAVTNGSAAAVTGTRYMTWDQVTPFASDRGVFYNFSAFSGCGGDTCDDIIVQGYVAASSLDSAAEFARIWARNQSGAAYTQIYQCSDATSCEFATADVLPSSSANFTFFRETLRENLSMTLSDTMFFHIAGVGSAAADNMFFEDINITGTRKQYPNVTSAGTGTVQQWIERRTNITDATGIAYIFMTNLTSYDSGNYSAATSAIKNLYSYAYNYSLFQVIDDYTAPSVTLNGPANGTESNSSVTFSYRINDTLSTIRNCTLLIDNLIVDTDTVIEEGFVNFFFPRIPTGGWHNWSVNCTDYYYNTGASQQWEVFIRPPDLYVNQTTIHTNSSNPVEGDNITINATAFNIGGSDALNVQAEFYLGDPDNGGVQFGPTYNVNITDIGGTTPNTTLNASYIITGPGPYTFWIVLDPPAATNGSIFENNETNNKANITINVSGYHYFYGNINNTIILANGQNQSIYYYSNISNVTGNVLAASKNSSILFGNLQALGRTATNTSSTNDFSEIDSALNMSSFNDSINLMFAQGNNTPHTLTTFNLFNRNILNTPTMSSTNNTNFITGILWDMGDGGVEYTGTQDIVFITNITIDKIGKYGTYDYELRVPVLLENFKGGPTIEFYWEIKS